MLFRSHQFQSTHPHGVRLSHMAIIIFSFSFQSTHPHGVRLTKCLPQIKTLLVSIHAPAWGATRSIDGTSESDAVSIHAPAWGATDCKVQRNLDYSGFNPRTRMGCDVLSLIKLRKYVVSIHAPAWGATCIRLSNQEFSLRFNPRTRMGCDKRLQVSLLILTCFNPRTRMGRHGSVPSSEPETMRI